MGSEHSGWLPRHSVIDAKVLGSKGVAVLVARSTTIREV